MQLTVSSDIALRTLIYLGQQEMPVTISKVAEECGISKSSLMKVVMTLVSANLILGDRGRNGGNPLAPEGRRYIHWLGNPFDGKQLGISGMHERQPFFMPPVAQMSAEVRLPLSSRSFLFHFG